MTKLTRDDYDIIARALGVRPSLLVGHSPPAIEQLGGVTADDIRRLRPVARRRE